MNCDCYKIIVAETHGELADLVHKEICKGMIPIGGPIVAPDTPSAFPVWAQAVCVPATLVNTKLLGFIEGALKKKQRRCSRLKTSAA